MVFCQNKVILKAKTWNKNSHSRDTAKVNFPTLSTRSRLRMDFWHLCKLAPNQWSFTSCCRPYVTYNLSLQRISSPQQWLPVHTSDQQSPTMITCPTTDQQSLTLICCPYNRSAVPDDDYLLLQQISIPWQWLPVPTTDQESLTLISCPYNWSAVPNNDYLSLLLISSPWQWLLLSTTDQQSLTLITIGTLCMGNYYVPNIYYIITYILYPI